MTGPTFSVEHSGNRSALRRRGARNGTRSRHVFAVGIPGAVAGALVLLLAPILAGAQASAAAQATVAPVSPASRFVVVLDAAHGGDDTGAKLVAPNGGTELEKDYILAFSVRLRSLLAARAIDVVTTRESDINLDSQQRAEIADHPAAQACIVLHAAMSGSGVHLFISSLPPAQRATFAPWNTAQAAWVPRSIALAGMLNSALRHAGVKVTIGRTALTTVDSMTCPAVAIEVAPQQTVRPSAPSGGIDDPDYQAQVAEAIAAGLLEWRGEGQNP